MDKQPVSSTDKSKIKLSLDLRIVSLLLLAVIAGMLVIWKPWASPIVSDRTIEVTGEAKVTATPDEYVFYPSYEFKNADKAVALAELTKKSDEIVTKLKALGVPSEKIKTNSGGYDFPVYYDINSRDATYTLSVTVTVGTKDLAQKVEDYLVTTVPTGSVSPQAQFSESMQKTLESQARDKATKEARAKADQSAKNLGFKVGKVKSIADGAGFNGGIYPMSASANSLSVEDSKSSLAVQPGQNDLNYSVSVVYYIR